MKVRSMLLLALVLTLLPGCGANSLPTAPARKELENGWYQITDYGSKQTINSVTIYDSSNVPQQIQNYSYDTADRLLKIEFLDASGTLTAREEHAYDIGNVAHQEKTYQLGSWVALGPEAPGDDTAEIDPSDTPTYEEDWDAQGRVLCQVENHLRLSGSTTWVFTYAPNSCEVTGSLTLDFGWNRVFSLSFSYQMQSEAHSLSGGGYSCKDPDGITTFALFELDTDGTQLLSTSYNRDVMIYSIYDCAAQKEIFFDKALAPQ